MLAAGPFGLGPAELAIILVVGFMFLFWGLIVWGCVSLAKSKNRSVGLAVVLGLIFGLIGLLVMVIMPKKQESIAAPSDHAYSH